MIELTRLNGHPITVNSDLIKFVEAMPDTVLSLVTGDRLIVLESTADVVKRVTEFRASVLSPGHLMIGIPNASTGAA